MNAINLRAMADKMTAGEAFKHALISILVGAIIAFITTLLQGLVDYLKHLNIEPLGAISGVLTYVVRTFRKG